MYAQWFPGEQSSDQLKHIYGTVEKLRKKVQRGRQTDPKFFELLIAELEELRAFEEHMQATVGNI